jgi:plastocyanin
MLHKTTPVNRLTLAAAAGALALAVMGAGCASGGNDEMTKAVVSGEKPVAMEGNTQFFDGKVAVKVTLSRGIGRGLRKGAGEKGDYTYQKYTDNENKQMLGSPLPPVTLHLILTDRAATPVTVTIVDFDSDMGNFVVDPDTLTIAPGQTGEPTSMVSELGVNADSMPFKVTLKYGAAKETQTFPVSLIRPDPGAAPAAAK